MTSAIDDMIKQQFTTIESKRAELDKMNEARSPSWKTNCVYVFRGESNNPRNLQILKVEEVLELVADVLARSTALETAAKSLGIPTPTKIQGFPVSDWVSDAKKRIAVAEYATKKKELDELESRLKSIVSPDLLRQMELDSITQALNKGI